MAAWFSNIIESIKDGDIQGAMEKTQSQISTISNNLKDTIQEKVSEVDAEADEIKREKEKQNAVRDLPWECSEEQSIVAEELMEKILGLSLNESNFLEEPMPPTCFDFDMEGHVKLITRMIELDPNLAKTHYRLSSKMDEELFWKNYFHRIALLRADVGVSPSLRVKRQTAAERQAMADKMMKGNGSGGGGGGSGFSRDSGEKAGSGSDQSHEPFAGSEASVVEVPSEGSDGEELGSMSDMEALDAEVNAELEDDFDFDGDGGSLDDGELDAELEAEIEAELGDD